MSILRTPKNQLYPSGTFVMIAKDLGPHMSHFEKDLPACVEYTYAQRYGGGKDAAREYSLLIRYSSGKWDSVAWYFEDQLKPIKDKKLIETFRKELK